jgi:flavin-dependent dehydrogenase
MSVRDVLIVGAGPSGLATAIASKQHGLDYALVEKGVLVNSNLQLPDAHGVLHHAGASRNRRAPAGDTL